MKRDPRIAAIIPAAGSGSRFGATVPKQFLMLAGEPVLRRTVRRFRDAGVERIVVAIASGLEDAVKSVVGVEKIELVTGGATRQESVAACLRSLPKDESEFDLIAVHDAVRPCFGRAMWDRLVKSALETGAAVPLMTPVDTVHRVHDGHILETPVRETLGLAQTPQLFRALILCEAFRYAGETGLTGTDEAGIVSAAGYPVAAVEGDRRNIKITTPEDLLRAEQTFGEWSVW